MFVKRTSASSLICLKIFNHSTTNRGLAPWIANTIKSYFKKKKVKIWTETLHLNLFTLYIVNIPNVTSFSSQKLCRYLWGWWLANKQLRFCHNDFHSYVHCSMPHPSLTMGSGRKRGLKCISTVAQIPIYAWLRLPNSGFGINDHILLMLNFCFLNTWQFQSWEKFWWIAYVSEF